MPARLPREVKIQRGTLRPCRERGIPTGEALVDVPRPPRTLDRDGRAFWREVAPVLVSMRVLTASDLVALRSVCEAFSHYRAADRLVQVQGLVVEGPSSLPHRNPAAVERETWWAKVRLGLSDFGLTPAARGRVVSGALADSTSSTWAVLAGGGRP